MLWRSRGWRIVFPVATAQLTYHCADCVKTKVQTVMNLTKVDRIAIIVLIWQSRLWKLSRRTECVRRLEARKFIEFDVLIS